MITVCQFGQLLFHACLCSADDILGITHTPTKRRRASTDYVCRPLVFNHPTRDLPHIHVHSNPQLQTAKEERCGGHSTCLLPAASDGVHGTDRLCSSILAPNDSQNWNVNYDLRRSTLASLAQPTTQLVSPLEGEEANCGTHYLEERLQFSQSLRNDEEGECTGACPSHSAPTKRVIVVQHHEGTGVSAGNGVNKRDTEGSVAGEGSPPS